MNNSIHRISLDIHDTGSQVSISAKKGDTARSIYITLQENCKPYYIAEGCYAVFTGVKSDGNYLFNDCTIKDNVIVYDFTEQTVPVMGQVKCEVVLYDANNERITSPHFDIMVEDVVYNDEEIKSSNEAVALISATAEAKAITAEVEQKLANGDFVGEKGEKGDRGDNGKDAIIDQTYDPESPNAQSGKAVSEALSTLEEIPSEYIEYAITSTPNNGIYAVNSIVLSDNVFKIYTQCGIFRVKKECPFIDSVIVDVAGNPFTIYFLSFNSVKFNKLYIEFGTQLEDMDTESYSIIKLSGVVSKYIYMSQIVHTYNSDGTNPVSGKAVAEALTTKIVNLPPPSGIFNLETNKIYSFGISSNVAFALPEVDNTKLNTIELQVTISNHENISIDLGATKYFGDIPELNNGSFIIYYEYDGTNWCVGALEIVGA